MKTLMIAISIILFAALADARPYKTSVTNCEWREKRNGDLYWHCVTRIYKPLSSEQIRKNTQAQLQAQAMRPPARGFYFNRPSR